MTTTTKRYQCSHAPTATMLLQRQLTWGFFVCRCLSDELFVKNEMMEITSILLRVTISCPIYTVLQYKVWSKEHVRHQITWFVIGATKICIMSVCLFAYEGTVRHLEAKSRTQYQGEKRILKKRFCDDWKDEIQIRLYTKIKWLTKKVFSFRRLGYPSAGCRIR